jgi:hypothetical protein
MAEMYLTGGSSPVQNEKEKYRWYACMETGPLKWICSRTSHEEALNLYLKDTNTKAVMVSKWVPKIFDPLYLHKAIHPHIKMSI